MVYEGGKSSCEPVGDEDNTGSEESEDSFLMRSIYNVSEDGRLAELGSLNIHVMPAVLS